MQYAFQDYDNLYLIMDLLTGGDLRYHISRHKKFSEEQTSKIIILQKYVKFLKIIYNLTIKLIKLRIFYCLHFTRIGICP